MWRRLSPLQALAVLLALFGLGSFVADADAARPPTAVSLVTRDAIVTSGRSFELELRCPGSARRCEGAATVRELRPLARTPSAPSGTSARRKTKKKLVLARGEVALDGGISTTVRLELTQKGFKRVRRHGPILARVVLRGRDATGRRVRLNRKVRIGVPVRQAPSLLVGVADDRIQGAPGTTADEARSLGVGAVRVLFLWERGQTTLSAAQAATLAGIVASAPNIRIVFASRSRSGTDAPLNETERAAYCAFLGDTAARFPQISDFGVWLEPNKQQFWSPQFDAKGNSAAPAAYFALLAQCYDVLHAVRVDVNVIGFSTASKGNDRPEASSNISHAPGTFIRRFGAAYRASGRTAAVLDSVGHHPYGEHSAERPWREHLRSGTLGLGDWHGLMQALHDAFEGTRQALPGIDGPQIWYLESGFQTVPSPTKASLHRGIETDSWSLPDNTQAADTDTSSVLAPDQATQLDDAIRLAYCQPYVAALFNFLLYDEADLNRWQSGLFWVDGTEKGSAERFRRTTSAAGARQIACSALKGGAVERTFRPKTSVGVIRIGWVRASRFNHKHDLWRARVRLDEAATYVAKVVPVRRRGTSARPTGDAKISIEGSLRAGFYSWVKFPRQRLKAGLYRIEVTITSSANPRRGATLDGPVFRVLARRS